VDAGDTRGAIVTGAGRFPATRHSVIECLDAADAAERRKAWETLIAAYWKPAYKHLRLSWNLPLEDAEDVTQEFFARALEGGMLERFEPGKARFRTYLRVCLDRFASNARKAEGRLKRGGAHVHLPLDFPGAERELGEGGHAAEDVDEAFRQEMIRALFSAAVDALREQTRTAGKTRQFAIFERYDLRAASPGESPPTYAALSEEFGVPVTQVTNYLAAMRRDFRTLVLERLREIAATDNEFRAEARELFGPGAA
jgi:RNA polymerase sigma factor (sigma-70 family)